MPDTMPTVDHCPLCKGEASITVAYVRCRSCHLTLPADHLDNDDLNKLAAKWNRRVATKGTEVQGKEHTITVPYVSEDDPRYDDTIGRTMWIAFDKDGAPMAGTLASTKKLVRALIKHTGGDRVSVLKQVHVRSAVVIAPEGTTLTIVEPEAK